MPNVGGICSGYPVSGNVELMYYISFRPPRAILDVIVLLRHSGDPMQATPVDFQNLPLSVMRQGGGSVLGTHAFFFDAESRDLWADGKKLVSLTDENLILIEEGVGDLDIVGVDHLDPDLGVVNLAPNIPPQWQVSVMPVLQSRLAGSSLAQRFIP